MTVFTFEAFCSVATALADKFGRFLLFRKLSLGTLLKLIFIERDLWRRVSRSILSGV